MVRDPWGGGHRVPPVRKMTFGVRGESRYHRVVEWLPGSVLVLEDTWGKGHTTRTVSEGENLIFGVALAGAPSE